MPVKFYYHPVSPPCQAVWVLLEELKSGGNFQYEEKVVDLKNQEHKSPEYLKINPAGAVPALTDKGFHIRESRVILEYLASRFGPAAGKESLFPNDDKMKTLIAIALFEDAENYSKIMAYLNPAGVFHRGEGLRETYKESMLKAVKSYDDMIGEKKFFVGDHVTVADFSCIASLGVLRALDFEDWDKYPNIKRWKEEMMKIPSIDKVFVQEENLFKKFFQAKLAENTK